MMKSTVWKLALSAWLVNGILIGAPQAQIAGAPTNTGTRIDVLVVPVPAMEVAGAVPVDDAAATAEGNASGRVPGLIAPSGLYGAGPPVDGLDSNPYREAPPQVRKALNVNGRATQAARGNAKPTGSSTSN